MKTFVAPLLICSGLMPALVCGARRNVFDARDYASNDILVRDVAIIGGGSSGVFAATKLRQSGKSVVVVEKEDRLGGHTSTYKDPATGVTVDYGVQAFWNTSLVRDYFAHYKIPITPYQFFPVKTANVDFRNGKPVAAPPSPNLTAYHDQLAKYPYLAYSWNLPSPTPEDLLLPFRDFVKKYNLGDLAFELYFASPGVSNILDQLTVNVFKFIDQAFFEGHGPSGILQVEDHDNSELFVRALAELGSNALLSSTVVAARRPGKGRGSESGVTLVVRTPQGGKLIHASKLLITIPPLESNMKPFGINRFERDLFSKWSFSSYYAMLINNTGLPADSQFVNTSPDKSVYNIPTQPASYHITATRIPGLFYSWYAGAPHHAEAEVKRDVTAFIKKLRRATNSTVTSPPNFVKFKDDSPFKLVVSADSIRQGFYKRLEDIQGYRDTWYTGAAFISHNAAVIWNFTDSVVLPSMYDSGIDL